MYWIAFGDIHESTSLLSAIPELPDAAGVLVSGDITNRGGAAKAREIFEAIAAINPRIHGVPGNMDTTGVETYLADQGYDVHRKVVELAPGVCLAAVGYSTPTPFGTPGEVSEQTLAGWLNELKAEAASCEHLVAMIHTPPENTATDVLFNGTHVGSPAVRRFLEEVRPAVSISGHIHESRGTDTVGRTTVLNPGMLADGGYVVVEFDGVSLTGRLGKVS